MQRRDTVRKQSHPVICGMILLSCGGCATPQFTPPRASVSPTASVALLVTPYKNQAHQSRPETRREAASGGVENAVSMVFAEPNPQAAGMLLMTLPAWLVIFPTVAAAQGVSEEDLRDGIQRTDPILAPDAWPEPVRGEVRSRLVASGRAVTQVDSASPIPAGSDYLLKIETFGPKLDAQESINPRMPVRMKLYGYLIDRRTGLEVRWGEFEGASTEKRKFLDWAKGDGPEHLRQATHEACTIAVDGLLTKIFE